MIEPALDDAMRSSPRKQQESLGLVLMKIGCMWIFGVAAIIFLDATPPPPISPFVAAPLWLQKLAGLGAWSGTCFGLVAMVGLGSPARLRSNSRR